MLSEVYNILYLLLIPELMEVSQNSINRRKCQGYYVHSWLSRDYTGKMRMGFQDITNWIHFKNICKVYLVFYNIL